MDQVRLGKYAIVREIARGSMGLVFQARDTVLNRTVALKILKEGDADERMVRRLHHEAEAAARLRHPNIISIHDVGVEGPVHYFAMDYIEGRSFDQVLESLPLSRSLEILRDVARAVDFAHRHGIVHRDLKPANILLDLAGRPIVSDFGLAKTHDTATHLTKIGAAIGTPHYMAPEQVRGAREQITPRTDVYALGVILYQILTRRLPHQGSTALEVFRAIIDEEPLPPQANPDLRTVCMKAMEKDPQHRYASAAAFADDLGLYLRGEPVVAQPPSTLRRVRAGLNHHPAIVAGLLAGLFALAIGGGLAWREMREKKLERSRAAGLATAQQDRDRRAQEAAPYFEAGKRLYEKARALRDSIRGGREEILPILDDSEKKLKAALDIYPQLAEAEDYWGRTFTLRYFFDESDEFLKEAERHFDRAVGLRPNLTSAHFERGRFHLFRYVTLRGAPTITVGNTGLPEFGQLPPESEVAKAARTAALEAFRRMAHPSTPPAELLWAEGAIAYADGNYSLAIRKFSGVLEKDPTDADTWYYQGMSRLFLSQIEEADPCFTNALKFMPRHAQALINRGLCRAALQRHRDAIRDFNDALAISNGFLVAYINRGLSYLALQEHASAERDYDHVLSVDPDNETALLNRGKIRSDLKNFEGAEEDWQKLAKLNPNLKMVHLNLGTLRAEQGNLDAAIGYYNRALALDSDYGSALFNRATAWLRKAEFEKSIADLTRVIGLAEHDAVAYNYRAIAREQLWLKNKDAALAELALKDYTRAIEIDKAYADAYFYRGNFHYQRSEWRKALDDFEKVREISKDFRPVVDPKIAEIKKILGLE